MYLHMYVYTNKAKYEKFDSLFFKSVSFLSLVFKNGCVRHTETSKG